MPDVENPVQEQIISCLKVQAACSKNLHDIRWYYEGSGGGATSAAYKICGELTTNFAALGELVNELIILVQQDAQPTP